MFKNFLSSTPPDPATSSVKLSSPPSNPNSPKPGKMSREKTQEDGRISSPTQIHLTKPEKYANIKSNDGNDDVPGLILPPSSPSNIDMRSDGTTDEIISFSKNRRGHTRDDSLETTVSQSMDMSSFIKSLELRYEDEQSQQQGNDYKKKAPEQSSGCGGSPHSGSLSLAVSQVDISLVNDMEDIQMDSNSDKSDSKILTNRNSNDKKTTMEKLKSNDDAEPVVLEESTEALMIDHSSSPSQYPIVKNSSHDESTMANVGEQLFRESLAQITTTGDVSGSIPCKRNSTTGVLMRMMTFMVVVIGIVAFIFGGDGNARSNPVTQITTLSTGCYFMSEECQASFESNVQGQEISLSQNTDNERVPIEKINDDDQDDSSIYLLEERAKHNDDELPNATKSSEFMHNSSNHLYEERKNHINDERSTHSKSNDYEVHGWMTYVILSSRMILEFCVLPVGLLVLFVALQTALFTSPSSFKGKSQIEAKMEVKKEPKTPVTPMGASLHRDRDSFLTPPISCKNRAHEPAEWMSPCYGEDAIDVSVYKAMKVTKLQELLRARNCDTAGTKEKMIKNLVMSYQSEFACLTVQKLRPKLRRRKLSQKGTKKDVVRRLVEAGPE